VNQNLRDRPEAGVRKAAKRARAQTSVSGPDCRTVRWTQLGLLLAIAAAFGLAYLSSEAFRSEVGKATSILGRGDLEGLHDYILSFGALAPVASLLLMVTQALVTPIPTFFMTFANGLAFGVFWGWVLSVTGHTLAAAVCFWLARVLGRGPVEALVGKVGSSQPTAGSPGGVRTQSW